MINLFCHNLCINKTRNLRWSFAKIEPMDLIPFLIVSIFVVPIGGMVLFSFLYAWGHWFSGGKMEYTNDRIWISVIALGLLFMLFVYLQGNNSL